MAAFELSCQALSESAQKLAALLSLFALTEIPWFLVQNCFTKVNKEELEEWRKELMNLSLLNRTRQGMYTLQQLLREFFAVKREEMPVADRLHQLFKTVRSLWQQAVDAPIDLQATWIHGDLHPRNILVDKGGITGVIDWGDLATGDRATDLAAFWYLFPDQHLRQLAIETYGEISRRL